MKTLAILVGLIALMSAPTRTFADSYYTVILGDDWHGEFVGQSSGSCYDAYQSAFTKCSRKWSPDFCNGPGQEPGDPDNRYSHHCPKQESIEKDNCEKRNHALWQREWGLKRLRTDIDSLAHDFLEGVGSFGSNLTKFKEDLNNWGSGTPLSWLEKTSSALDDYNVCALQTSCHGSDRYFERKTQVKIHLMQAEELLTKAIFDLPVSENCRLL